VRATGVGRREAEMNLVVAALAPSKLVRPAPVPQLCHARTTRILPANATAHLTGSHRPRSSNPLRGATGGGPSGTGAGGGSASTLLLFLLLLPSSGCSSIRTLVKR
jgi:hypothetical protein